MSYTIRITPPELRQKAMDIELNANHAGQDIADITVLVNRMRATFLGEIAASFFKEFDAACKDFNQWDNIVRSFALEIRDAAEKLERADKSH